MENKTAKELYNETHRELHVLLNYHWELSQKKPYSDVLPRLTSKIHRLAACCELWKKITLINATRGFFGR